MERFHLFSDLPPELRMQIWQHALSAIHLRPALYKYRPGCWESRRRTEFEWDYTPGDDEANWVLEFRHDKLEGRFTISLMWVSCESRDATFKWAAAQNDIEVRPGNNDGPMLLRAFDWKCDVIYVAPEDWHEFLGEEIEWPWEHGWDELGRSYSVECHARRLAVHEDFFKDDRFTAETRYLSDLRTSFSSAEVLYVVTGRFPKNFPHGSPPWRCELDDARGVGVVWDRGSEA